MAEIPTINDCFLHGRYEGARCPHPDHQRAGVTAPTDREGPVPGSTFLPPGAPEPPVGTLIGGMTVPAVVAQQAREAQKPTEGTPQSGSVTHDASTEASK